LWEEKDTKMSSHKDGSEKGIRAMLILDVIGRPQQYLVETLDRIIEDMGKENGVKIIGKNIKEPTVMKDNKKFYTTFSEIEVEVEDMLYLAVLMFKYMPAHVEVISPETISLSNNGWSEILSELTRRLHSYDEVARVMQIKNNELLKKIQELGGEKKGKDNNKTAEDKKSPKKRIPKRKKK